MYESSHTRLSLVSRVRVQSRTYQSCLTRVSLVKDCKRKEKEYFGAGYSRTEVPQEVLTAPQCWVSPAHGAWRWSSSIEGLGAEICRDLCGARLIFYPSLWQGQPCLFWWITAASHEWVLVVMMVVVAVVDMVAGNRSWRMTDGLRYFKK